VAFGDAAVGLPRRNRAHSGGCTDTYSIDVPCELQHALSSCHSCLYMLSTECHRPTSSYYCRDCCKYVYCVPRLNLEYCIAFYLGGGYIFRAF